MNLNLNIDGFSCHLYKDDVKTKEINRGALLIPYNGDKSIMLDRFDCRGFLDDLKYWEQIKSTEQELTAEWTRESVYDYDRYCDLYHQQQQSNEQMKRTSNRSSYRLTEESQQTHNFAEIEYAYKDDNEPPVSSNIENEISKQSTVEKETDYPYFCPNDLKSKLPPETILPDTERKAAIIEQTAKFIAEQGPQLEILIKTKQASNPNFNFLNYDHPHNAFYRHVTQLIKTAQYVPCKRLLIQFSNSLLNSKSDNNEPMTPPENLLPKIDINSTPYGLLVEKFRKKQQQKCQEKAESTIKQALGSKEDTISSPKSSTSTTIELLEARQKMYEQLYHQYYPHYYNYYNDIYQSVESQDRICTMARDFAANSAANWIQNNMPDPSSNSNGTDNEESNEIAIMRKMAEYVAQKGTAFEQMMLTHNGDQFPFLQTSHRQHKRYRRMLHKEYRRLYPDGDTTEIMPNSAMSSICAVADKNGSSIDVGNPSLSLVDYADSDEDTGEDDMGDGKSIIKSEGSRSHISFKLMLSKTDNTKAAQFNSPCNNVAASCELDDDFDFTEHLPSEPSSDINSSDTIKSNSRRLSRFSPSNPKNIIAISAQNFDQHLNRKRKAAQLVASKLLLKNQKQKHQENEELASYPSLQS